MGLCIPRSAGASQSHPLQLSSTHGSSPTGGAQCFTLTTSDFDWTWRANVFYASCAGSACPPITRHPPFFYWCRKNHRLIENSLLYVLCCLSIVTCFHVVKHFSLSSLEILWCFLFVNCFDFDRSLVYAQHCAVIVTSHDFLFCSRVT